MAIFWSMFLQFAQPIPQPHESPQTLQEVRVLLCPSVSLCIIGNADREPHHPWAGGEKKKTSFITLPGKGGHSRLMFLDHRAKLTHELDNGGPKDRL